MVVVGMCLVGDTGGCVRLAEAPASDRRNFAAQLHKWLMTMGFVVKLWSFHFYSIDVAPSQLVSSRRIRAPDPPSERDTFSALLLVVGIGAMAAPAEAARQAATPTKTTAARARPRAARAAGSQPRRRSPRILRSRRAPARPGSSVRATAARTREQARLRVAPGAAGGDDAALQDRRERRARSGHPRRRRHHLQSRRPARCSGRRTRRTSGRSPASPR